MAKAKRAKNAKKPTKKKAKAPAKRKVHAVPKRLGTVTAHLCVKGGLEAIQFYKTALGAKEIACHTSPDGKGVIHAEIRIGDSTFFLADEFPNSPLKAPKSLGGTTSLLNIYVKDCDALYNRAVAAGAKATMPPADMFWGDRYSQLEDPFGHSWAIATHKEDLTPKEMVKRSAAFFAQMG